MFIRRVAIDLGSRRQGPNWIPQRRKMRPRKAGVEATALLADNEISIATSPPAAEPMPGRNVSDASCWASQARRSCAGCAFRPGDPKIPKFLWKTKTLKF